MEKVDDTRDILDEIYDVVSKHSETTVEALGLLDLVRYAILKQALPENG